MTGVEPGREPETVVITRDQAARLMVVRVMLRDGDLALRGHESDDIAAANDAVRDVAEECALQLGGL